MKYAMLVRGSEIFPLMSAWGQSRQFEDRSVTSALPHLTDIPGVCRHVSKVPAGDILGSSKIEIED
jgi:hypothetical protein